MMTEDRSQPIVSRHAGSSLDYAFLHQRCILAQAALVVDEISARILRDCRFVAAAHSVRCHLLVGKSCLDCYGSSCRQEEIVPTV